MNFNSVGLHGRVCKDIELKGSEGKEYCSFTLAVNGYKDKVDFIQHKAFGKTAIALSTFAKKGKELVTRGRLSVDTVDTDGIKKTFTSVIVEGFDFCGSKSDGQASDSDSTEFTPTNDDEDDDLPF
ncbi:MAG: single-stranded DNA-binding protein [Cellulosilyticum sp.]|nr:single-stranded DNA-binding protein [Cellulosilyticum sp.]